jgi:hypothetical protein
MGMAFSSMVIDDLDVPGFAVSPNEANAPLLVDPNAVLSLPVAAQGFQAIAGRRPQIVNLLCRIDCDKLRARSPLDLPWQITDGVAGEDAAVRLSAKLLITTKRTTTRYAASIALYRKTVRYNIS